jgi:hypothetical protein
VALTRRVRIRLSEATHAGEWVIPYTSTGRTTIVIPVPVNEIVRADQNTANAWFLHSLINNLHDGRFELRTIKTVRAAVHIPLNDLQWPLLRHAPFLPGK